MGALLISKACEEFPVRIPETFTITPSLKVSDIVPSKVVLLLYQWVDNSDRKKIPNNEFWQLKGSTARNSRARRRAART